MHKTPIDIKEEILSKTKEGVKAAWNEAQELYGEIDDLLFEKLNLKNKKKFNKLFDAEYLITVNIAQSLKTLNPCCKGAPYRILLEHPTKDFATNCTPLIVKSCAHHQLPTYTTRSGQFNTSRNGKIDIAIYDNCTQSYSLKPICPIEVKGFNPSKDRVIADLKRNLDFFSIKSNTGNSELLFSVFATIEVYAQSPTEPERLSNIQKSKQKYTSYINCTNMPHFINEEVIVYSIDHGQPHETESPLFETQDYTITNHFHIIGIVIVFCNTAIYKPLSDAQSEPLEPPTAHPALHTQPGNRRRVFCANP